MSSSPGHRAAQLHGVRVQTLIYLAGRVRRTDSEPADDWREDWSRRLGRTGHYEFVYPDDPSLDQSVPEHVFGHDCYLIQQCDLVVVNAERKLGVGTSQEMIIARYFGKPVYTVLPPDSHHRRSNVMMGGRVLAEWRHPFVVCSSNIIFDGLDELATFLANLPHARPTADHDRLSYVDEAIEAYVASTRSDADGRAAVVG